MEERLILHDFKTDYNVIIIKAEWPWYKDIKVDKCNRVLSSELDLHIHEQLIFDRGAKVTQQGKDNHSTNDARTVGAVSKMMNLSPFPISNTELTQSGL